MKRCLPLVFVLLLLLFGCGKEIEKPQAGSLPANIRLTELTGERDFGGFTAGAPGEGAEEVRELVETALEAYPAGLLAQLGPVEVLLAGELTGDGQFSRGGYAGFAQRADDGWRVVLDAARCTAGTVHHELGHILDGILTAAGKLPPEDWLALCPPEFQYGAGDWESCGDFFVDAYAMTDMKEDRATVFEAAVLGGEGAFDGKSPLWLKLHTFSEAIRDHFDTTGWPPRTIWELALT